jgi:CheY-like chemotaxis protein
LYGCGSIARFRYSAMPPTSRRTLIVEDDASSRKALLRLVEQSGHVALGATTLAEAEKLLKWLPECVVLDLMLPDGSGIDFLQRIRREGIMTRVAVVSGAGQAMLDSARRHNPDAVFPKPVNVPQLLEWLGAACDRNTSAT